MSHLLRHVVLMFIYSFIYFFVCLYKDLWWTESTRTEILLNSFFVKLLLDLLVLVIKAYTLKNKCSVEEAFFV